MTSDERPPRGSSSGTDPASLLLVGIVHRPHGLAGEVSVESVTDHPERFIPGATLLWRKGEASRTLTVATARAHTRRLLVSFAGVSGVDSARALGEGELFVPREDARPAPAGSYYGHELEGFLCEDTAGHPIGVVRDLSRTAAGALLAVETRPGREALVPFVADIVRSIDRDRRRIVLDPPEGLFDL